MSVPASVPLDELRAALRAGPPLRLAILFGSAAQGRLRTDSDVDIAILPRDTSLPLADELHLQARLTRAAGRNVDLVRIDSAPTLLLWEIARKGQVLLEGGPGEAARFTARAASEYLDFAPAFDEAAERFRQRVAAGLEPG